MKPPKSIEAPILTIRDQRVMLARISHQIDEPSLAICFHKVFCSIGNTICIPLLRTMPCENKLLRDHLITW